MDIITALRQSTAPKPIDLSGSSSTKKIALFVFAFLAIASTIGVIWWFVKEPTPVEENQLPIIDYRTEILDAVKGSDADKLAKLLQNESVSLNIFDYGRSLFCIALEQYRAAMKNFSLEDDVSLCIGPMDVLDLLVSDSRCDVNSPFADGLSPLHYACLYCEDVLPELLKRSDLQIDVKDRDGKTPLHYGAENGPVSIVEKLCKARADVNVLDHGQKSPLSRALIRGNRVCVIELCKYQPKVTDDDTLEISNRRWTDIEKLIFGDNNSKSQLGFQFAILKKMREKTPTGCTAKFFIEKMQIIHDYIAPPSSSESTKPVKEHETKDEGWLEKAKAAYQACREADKTEDELMNEFVDEMISSGPSDNDHQDLTCSMAVMNNEVEIIKKFTKDQINTRDKLGNYPIQYVRTKEAIDELVAKGADVNIVDGVGRNLLHNAVFENNPDKIKALATKIDVNEKAASGEHALILAVTSQRWEALGALLEVDGIDLKTIDADDNTVCHHVVSHGIESVISKLIQKGADFAAENKRKQTPITFALEFAMKDDRLSNNVKKTIFSLLTTHKQPKRGHYLIMATRLGWNDVIDELLKGPNGVDINYQECYMGHTALHAAVTSGHLHTVKHLLKNKNIDPNIVDSRQGWPPIFYAAYLCGNDICRDILTFLDDINTRRQYNIKTEVQCKGEKINLVDITIAGALKARKENSQKKS